jgi:hypothetical protein
MAIVMLAPLLLVLKASARNFEMPISTEMPPSNPRFEAVIAASHGDPRDVLTAVVDDHVREALSENQQDRLHAATSEVIRVFPDREGLYQIRSPDGERGDHTRYKVDMLYGAAKTCTCGDYMYRCDPESGQMCKHLWRTKLLILLGAIPGEEANPYDWLLDELYRDRQVLVAMLDDEEGGPVARMDALINRLQNTHRIAVDFPQICTARANVLKAAQSE